MPRKFQRFFAIAGIIAPLILFFSVTGISLFWVNYNPLTQYISVLGSDSSPFQYFVNIFGFGFLGVVIIGLAFSLEPEFESNYIALTATRFLIGGGLLVFILGFFHTDPVFPPITLNGILHRQIANIAFILFPISIIWYGFVFKQEEDWGAFWSFASFLLALTAFSGTALLGLNPHFIYNGIIERFVIGTTLLWIFLVSFNLLLTRKIKEFVSSE